MKIILSDPDILSFADASGDICYGGSQEWYKDFWRRKSGCGPVAASNIIWYLTRQQGSRDQYIELMNEMFTFVTPGMRGVNNASIFSEGIIEYVKKHGLLFAPHVLELPAKPNNRPGLDTVYEFIESALRADSPVAFLCLSSGKVDNLDDWHWVTIISLDTDATKIEVLDYGKRLDVCISAWLESSRLGGALVFLNQGSGNCISKTEVSAARTSRYYSKLPEAFRCIFL